ncbi:MAG: DUF1570 domain-containing protein [Pirellulales bacterium]|nr:DUF1570 domain-containing protein [Pirellulales bacterium]
MRTIAALAAALVANTLSISPARGVDEITLRRDDGPLHVTGRVLVTAEDGGLLLETASGALHLIEPADLVRRASNERPFEPLAADALAKQVLSELPAGFDAHRTAHYVVCYNTSRAYAQWCGGVFERLYAAFTNFWSRREFELRSPEFPLVAIVFADQQQYGEYTRRELKDAAAMLGYYNLKTNRMALVDLTGVTRLRSPRERSGSAAEINLLLSRPAAERSVATIVHEATHQIAFNTGLATRLADIPLWSSEGLAMYFETPDLTSGKGWRTIGAVNTVRLEQFREYLARRPADALKALIEDDRRFRDPQLAQDAYAEAWALTYFLVRQRWDQYAAYTRTLAAKGPLVWDTPAERIDDFERAFGDLTAIDADFVRQIQKLR